MLPGTYLYLRLMLHDNSRPIECIWICNISQNILQTFRFPTLSLITSKNLPINTIIISMSVDMHQATGNPSPNSLTTSKVVK